MDDYQPGGPVPPAPTTVQHPRVVFVPLGYGPAVAARAARLALLHGVEAHLAAALRYEARPDAG